MVVIRRMSRPRIVGCARGKAAAKGGEWEYKMALSGKSETVSHFMSEEK
jgi:hypothetical protein